MEVSDGNEKGCSSIDPCSDAGSGEMADIVYPPQVHKGYDSAPLEAVQQKIPINIVMTYESATGYCYNCNGYRTTEVRKKRRSGFCCYVCIITVTCPFAVSTFL